MDIGDITKHPFKIECPAELKEYPGEPFGDHWLFTFDNDYSVSCIETPDGLGGVYWEVAIVKPGNKAPDNLEMIGYMTDDRGEISDLIDRIAHIGKPT